MAKRHRKPPLPPPPATTPLEKAERRLAEAVKDYRKRGGLHDSSADIALVGFAHGKGEDLTGAPEVREALAALRALSPVND